MSEDPPELQDIACGADEHLSSTHPSHPAQQELSIAAVLLDLAEYRFDDRFATSVTPSPVPRTECATHAIGHRQARWWLASRRGG